MNASVLEEWSFSHTKTILAGDPIKKEVVMDFEENIFDPKLYLNPKSLR